MRRAAGRQCFAPAGLTSRSEWKSESSVTHELAGKRRSEATATYTDASRRAAAIPFGQPILVGHHSEQRDRNYRDRTHNMFGKSFELDGKAKYWETRADSAESSRAISSDDPTALEQLQAKLEDLEHAQECMKAVNRAWRTAGKPTPDNTDGWAKVTELQDLVSATDIERLRVEYARLVSWQSSSAPFPGYSLSNNSAEMRRVRQRITELEASANAEHVEKDRGVCRYVEDPEVNRVQLFFDGKPPAETRKILKQNGFRFSKRDGNAWQRQLNDAGIPSSMFRRQRPAQAGGDRRPEAPDLRRRKKLQTVTNGARFPPNAQGIRRCGKLAITDNFSNQTLCRPVVFASPFFRSDRGICVPFS